MHYILRKSADFLRRFNAPVGEVGGVALSYVCLCCRCLPLEDYSWSAPQGMCDNLIISLKLLTNQQRDGDSPVESIVTGLLEKSRKGIMDGIRKFIAVDITKQ